MELKSILGNWGDVLVVKRINFFFKGYCKFLVFRVVMDLVLFFGIYFFMVSIIMCFIMYSYIYMYN